VQERLRESGKSWEDAVLGPELQLPREDFEGVDAELLATGHRYTPSAEISIAESPRSTTRSRPCSA